jgi:hypothetical protein
MPKTIKSVVHLDVVHLTDLSLIAICYFVSGSEPHHMDVADVLTTVAKITVQRGLGAWDQEGTLNFTEKAQDVMEAALAERGVKFTKIRKGNQHC